MGEAFFFVSRAKSMEESNGNLGCMILGCDGMPPHFEAQSMLKARNRREYAPSQGKIVRQLSGKFERLQFFSRELYAFQLQLNR